MKSEAFCFKFSIQYLKTSHRTCTSFRSSEILSEKNNIINKFYIKSIQALRECILLTAKYTSFRQAKWQVNCDFLSLSPIYYSEMTYFELCHKILNTCICFL